MAKKQDKKIVLLIVEGSSEEIALSTPFKEFFDKNRFEVEVVGSDITTQKGASPQNIISKVTQIVKDHANGPVRLSRSDFAAILHLIDTDGAFVDPSVVIENCSLRGEHSRDNPIKYYPDHMEAKFRDRAITRNKCKAKNLRVLAKTSTLWEDIPYFAFFMSCNLDHVLHNEPNLSPSDKSRLAEEFDFQYSDRFEDFVSFLSSAEIRAPGSYADTWQYIQQENHSLERRTNLGLVFTDTLAGLRPKIKP